MRTPEKPIPQHYTSPVKTYRIREVKYSNGTSKFIPEYSFATDREKIKFFHRSDLWLPCIGVPECYKNTLEVCRIYIKQEMAIDAILPVVEIGDEIHDF